MDTTEVQSYLFDRSKTWNLEKAKEWFEKHREGLKLVKEHVHAFLPFKVSEEIMNGTDKTPGTKQKDNLFNMQGLSQNGIDREIKAKGLLSLFYIGMLLACFTEHLLYPPRTVIDLQNFF